jgi:DNA-binding NtrC family response regulator
VKATQLGARDFLEKPIARDRLLVALRNALQHQAVVEELDQLKAEVGQFQMVGKSAAMEKIYALIRRIAPSEGRVLITGENGSGKELIARAIHRHSRRRAGPFVKLNCAAVPHELIESELFGHERGAFTGAVSVRRGKFELAHEGTLFLDEIGDMPAAMQAKLLRVLQEGELERVGGSETLRVDVRVIAATNKDLTEEIQAGRFREDLYYRLAQVRVSVPPLRDRPEDIPVLAQKLLASLQTDNDAPVLIEQASLDFLATQPWPGNVRELRNVLARATALASDGIVRRRDVAGEGFGFRGTRQEREALDLSGTFASAKEGAIDRFESAYLAALMKRCGGNLSLAARQANVARHHLRDLLKKRGLYGISWIEEKQDND